MPENAAEREFIASFKKLLEIKNPADLFFDDNMLQTEDTEIYQTIYKFFDLIGIDFVLSLPDEPDALYQLDFANTVFNP